MNITAKKLISRLLEDDPLPISDLLKTHKPGFSLEYHPGYYNVIMDVINISIGNINKIKKGWIATRYAIAEWNIPNAGIELNTFDTALKFIINTDVEYLNSTLQNIVPKLQDWLKISRVSDTLVLEATLSGRKLLVAALYKDTIYKVIDNPKIEQLRSIETYLNNTNAEIKTHLYKNIHNRVNSTVVTVELSNFRIDDIYTSFTDSSPWILRGTDYKFNTLAEALNYIFQPG